MFRIFISERDNLHIFLENRRCFHSMVVLSNSCSTSIISMNQYIIRTHYNNLKLLYVLFSLLRCCNSTTAQLISIDWYRLYHCLVPALSGPSGTELGVSEVLSLVGDGDGLHQGLHAHHLLPHRGPQQAPAPRHQDHPPELPNPRHPLRLQENILKYLNAMMVSKERQQ